jgi:hypothetical protein
MRIVEIKVTGARNFIYYPMLIIVFSCFLNPVSPIAAEWVVLSEIDKSKKSERIKYAEFLKNRHYQIPYRIIPELTPQEKEWLNNRKKSIDDTLKGLKGGNRLITESEEGRAWLAMDAQYRSSNLYLQNELRRSLNHVITALDIIIGSKDVLREMEGWSLLVDALLDHPLNGDNLNKSISNFENNKGIVFPKKYNFLFQNMSIYIAREINLHIILSYFGGRINE